MAGLINYCEAAEQAEILQTTPTPRPAVFLDRDGVLIEEVGYLADPGQVVLIAGAGPAIAALNRAGIPAVVVTNQAGIARGYLSEARLAEIHGRLAALLAAEGARIDASTTAPTILPTGLFLTGPCALAASPNPGCCSKRQPTWESICRDRS